MLTPVGSKVTSIGEGIPLVTGCQNLLGGPQALGKRCLPGLQGCQPPFEVGRSAKISGQIVEEKDGSIYLWLDGADAPSIYFSKKTGHSGSKATEKLRAVLDAAGAEEASEPATYRQ